MPLPSAASRRLAALLEEGERDLGCVLPRRADGDALVAGADEPLVFRWRLLVLRALLEAPPGDDSVAELYGELVDRARGDDARMAVVRGLGERIRALTAEGSLPRTMQVRTPRRRTQS